MSDMFDVKRGALVLRDGIVLRRGLAPSELTRAGIRFSREVDMKTGWVWRSPGPLFAKDGTELHAGLGFLDERLASLRFGLAEAPDEITARFAFHEKFLEAQLGQAFSYNLGETLYRYRWGSICAAMDIRGGGSYIVVAWDQMTKGWFSLFRE